MSQSRVPQAGRRRSQRVPTQLVGIWHRRSGDVDVVCTDINADGLFVCNEEIPQPGALIELRLQLPEGALHVLAIVRFVGFTQSGRGFGVELFTMAKQARRRWLAYYRQQNVPNVPLADASAVVSEPTDDEDDGIGPIDLDLGGLVAAELTRR